MRLFPIAAVLTVAVIALAPHAASAGLLDTMQDTVHTHTAGWLTKALQLASGIFKGFLFLFFLVTLCRAGLKSWSGDQDIGSVLHEWAAGLWWAIIPTVIMLIGAPAALPDLVGSALTLSGAITGDAVAKTPDAVFLVGIQKAVQLITATTTPLGNDLLNMTQGGIFGIHSVASLGTSLVMFVVGLVVAAVIVVTFTLLACNLLSLTVRVYLVISIGAVNLGFLGSPGTAGMAQPYINAVWASIIRLIALTAWISLVSDLVADWGILAANTTLNVFLFASFELLAASAGVLYLTIEIGKVCDEIAGSGSGFSVGAAMASTATRAGVAAFREVRRRSAA
jgi:P-type conjugative transfer protein TrbL